MKKWLALPLALLAVGTAHAETTDDTPLEQAADVMLYGIPLVALGLTYFFPADEAGADPAQAPQLGFDFVRMTGEPRHDLGLAILRTQVITYGLKFTVDSERPNGKDGSFPSGHTATTFAGAEFIRKEYGWGWGTAAFVASSFVGWSRVQTGDHHWHDVLAGAAIGVASNHDMHEFKTTFGLLSVKPALVASRSAGPLGAWDPQPDVRPDGSETAPGLALQLRF